MSLYTNNSTLVPKYPLVNGYATQLTEKLKNNAIYLDVTPARTARGKSSNSVSPLQDNFINPKISRDIVYENIKPIFTLMRLMGVLPLTRPSPGVNTRQFTSPSMLYSVVIFTFLVSYVAYISLNKVQIFRNAEGKFEEAVIEYLFTVYLFPMLTVPLLWYESGKIAGVLNGWVKFEVAYKRLCDRPLSLKLYKKSLAISIIIPMLSTALVIVTHGTMINFKPTRVLPYVFLEIMTYILGGYWYLLCETLSICANILAEDFQQAIRHIGPAGKVAEYRALWLQLSKLTRDTGIANCYTFTFLSLYLFFIITLSIYGLLSQISEGFGTKDIGLAMTAVCSVFLLFFICDEAHCASHDVRINFQKKLLLVELSWMNTDAQTEVNMFLRATEMNPSQISLGGFFDVNRNLFKSLMATMVTYLVVLLQFQISIPDDAQVPPLEGEVYNQTSESSAQYTESTITTMTTALTTLAKKKKKH